MRKIAIIYMNPARREIFSQGNTIYINSLAKAIGKGNVGEIPRSNGKKKVSLLQLTFSRLTEVGISLWAARHHNVVFIRYDGTEIYPVGRAAGDIG